MEQIRENGVIDKVTDRLAGKVTSELDWYENALRQVVEPENVRYINNRTVLNIIWFKGTPTILLGRHSSQGESWYDGKDAVMYQVGDYVRNFIRGKTFIYFDGDVTMSFFGRHEWMPFKSLYESALWVLENKFGISSNRITRGTRDQDLEIDGKKIGGWAGTTHSEYNWEAVSLTKLYKPLIMRSLLPDEEHSRLDADEVTGLADHNIDIVQYVEEIKNRLIEIEIETIANNPNKPTEAWYGSIVDYVDFFEEKKLLDGIDLVGDKSDRTKW